MNEIKTVREAARDVPVVSTSDVLVVGGGAAGLGAAVSAARNGASVTMLERYPHLGGMASGGMVLVLDDMTNGAEITVTGIMSEVIERIDRIGLAVYPPEDDRRLDEAMFRRWARWGCNDFHQPGKLQPIIYSVAFDPDGWKRVSLDLVKETGVNLRLHSWFSEPIVEDGRIRGVICETKMGRQAMLADVVIDATGDLDVAYRSGAEFTQGAYIVTTVFRLGGVDTDTAEAFEWEQPDVYRKLDRQARRIIGGAWERWWLKTPLPGIVWCNCPHMTGYDGLSVEHLTAAEFDGRERMVNLLEFARANMPGFEKSYLLDSGEQIGVRQTRLLQGDYVVTKEDIVSRRHFPDSVCRGRDYYTPYRSLLPRGIEQMVVAGRHYSATPEAQKMSREIPPCMAQGEAAGIAASLALNGNVPVREVDPAAIQKQMRAQGADPGDVPSANAASLDAAE
ncbi:FAD-dependent oxidoreductase [Oceanibacterium hippocampi]|uniref:Putative FAD-binding dehydrogenase n=1 Tax=Oceanibacterium hippocampi TaxID=745714 RepID=A0A1Y5SL21_9PROT|nr:FAD-dependent oxidoreductase [Oceanibacterium hippocampi]SLN43252.1 putative FAD-binding dehydrogenase [Oceanibacterium hippocampi]